MSPTSVVSELGRGLEESQNQRDARIEELWFRLDPGRTGELDFKALREGFRRIDHRTAPSPSLSKVAVSGYRKLKCEPSCSTEKCRPDAEEDSG